MSQIPQQNQLFQSSPSAISSIQQIQSPQQFPSPPQNLHMTQSPQQNNNSNDCNNEDAFAELLSKYNHPDVIDAKTLFDNAKFYYLAGQLSGALVSFSCASVLLNSIVRAIGTESDLLPRAENLLQCCLQAVNVLQPQVMSSSKPKKDDEENQDWAKICTKIKPLVFSKGSADCLFFSGVAGLNKEKKLFKTSLIFPLTYPNLYPKASKGILLYGPPGTGKTYIVKAAVNELQKSDPSVGVVFFSPSPADLKGKYVGETEKKIEEIFTCASRAACESELGCTNKKKYQAIIFMDEFDAIGPDRSDDPTGLAANSVNTLLQMMDGIKSKPNVAVIAATNFPWKLDSAILRRFTTQILIDLPNSNDIKQLLNIEIKKMVEFKGDKKFSWCESQRQMVEKEKETGPLCDFECEEKIPVDLSTIAPYNSVEIDYYTDKEYIDGLVNYMATNNFSNSDVARFMLAAQTNSGELAVKSNIFYKASLLQDFTHDVYISSLTKEKNSTTGIKNAIKLLGDFVNNTVSQNFFQVQPPDILRIEYNGYYYYNVKSLYYKNNSILIEHPSVKDVYVKVHPVSIDTDKIDEEMYNTNVLGIYEKTPDMPVDIIITFDFYIKQKNTGTSQILLPLSHDLINKVFKPIYNTAKTIYTKIQDLNSTQTELKPTGPPPGAAMNNLGDKWFTDTYPTATVPSNDTFFNVAPNNPFFTPYIGVIQDVFKPSIDENTIKDFSLKYTNFDFYNYILLYSVIKNQSVVHESLVKTQKDTPINPSSQSIDTNISSIINNQDLAAGPPAPPAAPPAVPPLLYQDFLNKYVSSLKDPFKNVYYIQINVETITKDLYPFELIQTNNIAMKLLYSKATNSCFIHVSDCIELIKNFNFYNDVFSLFNKNVAVIQQSIGDSDYISFDIEFFKTLFRNSFDTSKMLSVLKEVTGAPTMQFPEMDNTKFQDVEQRLIQLFINDILSFQNLTNSVYENDKLKMDDAQTYIKTMFTNLNNTNAVYYELIQLICSRVYNNSNFVQTQSAEFQGGSNDIQIPLMDINEDSSVKMGGKKKFRLTKNKSKRVIKYSRKKQIKNVNKTKRLNDYQKIENNNKIVIDKQSGGALSYPDFIKFVTAGDSLKTESIVNKTIFVKTKYDYSAITSNFLRKKSVLNGIFYTAYDLFGDPKNYTSEKILDQLKKKNQYLPLIFKQVEAIGFLNETAGPGTTPTGTTPTATPTTGTTPTTATPTTTATTPTAQQATIDDRDIKQPVIIWGKVSQTFVAFLSSILPTATGTSGSNLKNVISGILMAILTFNNYLPSSVTGQIASLGTFVNQLLPSVSTAALAGSLSSAISPYLPNVNFQVDMTAIASNITSQNAQNLGIFLLIIYLLGNLYSLATSTNVNKETILNDLTLTVFFNIITEIQQVETNNLSQSPLDIFQQAIKDAVSNISWWNTFTSEGRTSTNVGTQKTLWNTKLSQIKKYSQNQIPDPDIKRKLTNLNIPLTSFSYALTLVKTTYVKETGRQLKLYDTDKEALFKELASKKK